MSEARESPTGQIPYSGYLNSTRPEEDKELTHSGRGSPGGEYMRRFWLPIGLTSEIGERPKPVRVLNEDLVAFRDKSERYGLLHQHCAHRGTSLEYGIPQERGLRCCYHGWTYDIDGTCLDTPGEPPNSRLKESVFQGAYPVRDYHGLLFAYLGPPDEVPDFPLYDAIEYPDDNEIYPYALDYECNWLQSHENGADPVHGSFLHAVSSGTQFTDAFAEMPIMQYFETPLGLIASATGAEGVGEEAGKQVVLDVYSTVGWYAIAIGVGVMVISPLIKKLMHLDTLQDDDVGDDLLGQSEGPGEPQGAGIHPETRPLG